MQKKIKKTLLFSVFILLLLMVVVKIYSSKNNEKLFLLLANENIIMHALGEIDGIDYTNSLEALEKHYSRGRRTFEVDFAQTNDNKVVANHSKKINMSATDFLEKKIAEKYTPMSLEDILDKMVENEDMILVTDIKENFREIIFEIIKQAKKRNLKISDRIVPQVYSKETYNACMEAYQFNKVIYSLYLNNPKDEDVMDFVKRKENIYAVTMSKSRFSKRIAEKINNLGRLVFVHTLNDREEVKRALSRGARGIYTDSF